MGKGGDNSTVTDINSETEKRENNFSKIDIILEMSSFPHMARKLFFLPQSGTVE
jgi:hypothetical protein